MEPTLKRRLFVSAAAAATVLPVATRAQTPVTLKIGIIPAEICGQVIYGVEAGYFSRAGLDVQTQTFPSGGAIASALAGGALDIGMVDLTSMINAHVRGIPFVALAPGLVNSSEAPTFAIVVRGDSDIRAAKDLNGKSVGVNGLNNIAQVSAMAWIDNNGGNSKTREIRQIAAAGQSSRSQGGNDRRLTRYRAVSHLRPRSGLSRVLHGGQADRIALSARRFLLNARLGATQQRRRGEFISVCETSVWANANHQLTARCWPKQRAFRSKWCNGCGGAHSRSMQTSSFNR